ncbi:adenylate/guanylate cyclase domain-containing protein [Methylobacterium sp. JK268]
MHKPVERRLAAILITDLVGYSRMIGADEAGTLRRLKRLRRDIVDPRIAAARGRVVKSTGDGVIAEFPSPVRAVSCAVAIQRAAAAANAGVPEAEAMRMRIGINLGDVVAEADGDLYGDGVNVAARLEPLAEPGGLCISRAIHDQVRDRLPYRFEDRGEHTLKNIARPVGVFTLPAAAVLDSSEDEPLDGGTARRGRRRLLAAGAAGLLLAAGAGWWVWKAADPAAQRWPGPAREGATALPRLSLVVLPFSNLSSDPEQEFFADGLTEDLTTDLSHLSGSFVIARNTAFTYKGKAIDVRQVGRDLGVRYVLEGSVRRTGDAVVVNAQLISAETGAHLWADRFEGDRGKLGELQADFVARLARSLDIALVGAESLRSARERPLYPDASDMAMLGRAALNRPRTKQSTLDARSAFEGSLAIDPTDVMAKIGLARAIVQLVNARWSADPATDLETANRLIAEALRASPGNALAHFVMGEIFRFTKNFDRSLSEARIAIDYDPNLTPAYASAGLVSLYDGHAGDLFPYVEKAMRLSPKDPLMSTWEYYICHAHTHLGHWQDAITWCNRSVGRAPYWAAYIDLVVAYTFTGRTQEAAEAMAGVVKLMPGYTVQKWIEADWSRNPTFLAEYQTIVDGLRRAGFPER